METIKDRLSEYAVIHDERNIVRPFPKNMLLELTNKCNDTCLFCANSKSTKERGDIDRKFAKRVLKEAYDLGTREVGFYGTGEPLLNKNLEEYISYAKQLGYEYTYLTTNGALLSEERAKLLMASGIDSIKFSINASNEKDYELIHGKDEFGRVIENLIYFDQLRKKYGKNVKVYISFVSTRLTCKNKQIFLEQYMQYADDIVFRDCRNIDGCMGKEIRKYLSVDNNRGHFFDNEICPLVFKNLYVTYEGYLTMCCADFQNYLAVADLKKERLEDAWNNSYAKQLRKRFLEHRLEGTLCYNCIYDCAEEIEPLRKEYAVLVPMHEWDKCEEIEKRISRWQSADG